MQLFFKVYSGFQIVHSALFNGLQIKFVISDLRHWFVKFFFYFFGRVTFIVIALEFREKKEDCKKDEK